MMTRNGLFTKLIVPVLLPLLAWVGVTAEETPVENIPGGFFAAPVKEDVKMAAEFAVQELSKREAASLKLSNIFKAKKQIVAGVNYRLDIAVKRGGSERKARVVVFKDLKSRYKLTSWEWLNQ